MSVNIWLSEENNTGSQGGSKNAHFLDASPPIIQVLSVTNSLKIGRHQSLVSTVEYFDP